MARRYFNWKLAIVLVLCVIVMGVTAYGLRQWQRSRRAESGLKAGLKAYSEHRWEEAARNLGRYLAVVRDDVEILLKYADAQFNIRPLKRSNLRQAIEAYRTVLRVDKSNSEAAIKLAGMYLEMGTPGEAELITGRYLETKDDPELRRILAIALARQRKFDEAASELKKILAEHPEQILAYEALAQLCEHRPQDFPGSPARYFDEAVKNNPSSALAYIIRASFHLRGKERIKAIADLEQADKLDLSDAAVRLRLAREFINANVLDKAEEHLAVLQTVEPANQSLWRIFAELALKSQSRPMMLKTAEAGLKALSSQPWDFMPTAAELFIRSGELDRVADCISKLRQKDIAPAIVAFLEGLVAELEGHGYEAVKCWHRAMELGNKSTRVRLSLASTLSRLGDAQSALRQLRSLVSERPNFFEGRFALAKLMARTGRWAEAAEQARIARQISPDNLSAVLLHIQSQIQLLAESQTDENSLMWQEIDKQLARLESAIDSALEIKLLRFQLKMRQHNFADAEVLLTELKKTHASEIKVLMAEAELLEAQEREEEAVSVLGKTVSRFPQAVEPVRSLTILLAERGDHEKCEAIIEEALTRIEQPVAQRELGLLLVYFYERWGWKEKTYKLIISLAGKLPNDVPIKRRLLRCEQVMNNVEQAQKLVDDIKSLEGERGCQWRYEQARILFAQKNFKKQYPQIVSLLKENLLVHPDDQDSRLLLAAAHERTGELRLAVSIYDEALSRSPRNIRIIIPTVAALYKANEYDRVDEILRRAAKEKLVHPALTQFELQSHLRRGELSSASEILEDLLANDPNNRSICLSLALLKMRQSRFAEAGELLGKLKIQEPNSLRISIAQIELNVREGKSDEALLLCDEIVNKLNNASAHILRGRTYAMLGQSDRAEKDFEYATIIEPNNVEAWTARSDYYRSIDYIDEAMASIQKAMSLEPDNVGTCKRAISLFLASTERDIVLEGKNILDEALASNPEDIQLRLYKARSLLAEGTAPAIENAAQILQKITEDHPTRSDAWALLAEIALRQGESLKAIDVTLQGLIHQPNYKPLFLLKARAEADRSPALGISTLKGLYELDPNDVDVAVFLARTYIAAGSPEKAVSLLRKQLNMCDVSTERRCKIALAFALYKNGEQTDAQKEFNALYESEPNDPGPLFAQVKLLKEDGLWSQLSQKVDDWFQSHPEDTRTPITVVNNLAAAKSTEAEKVAEDLLHRVLERHPNFPPALMRLAMLSQITGRSEESAALYQKILEVQPDNVVAINNLAWIMCEEQGKYRKALELAQRGLEISPDYIDLIDTRGVVYYRLGEFEKAVHNFTRCVKLYPLRMPASAASYFHLGRVLAKLEQGQDAVENLNKALQLNTTIGGLSATDISEAQSLLEELLQEG